MEDFGVIGVQPTGSATRELFHSYIRQVGLCIFTHDKLNAKNSGF